MESQPVRNISRPCSDKRPDTHVYSKATSADGLHLAPGRRHIYANFLNNYLIRDNTCLMCILADSAVSLSSINLHTQGP